MNTPLRFLFSFLACIISLPLFAQPKNPPLPQGCHYHENHALLPPMSDLERSMVCGSNARSDSIDILNYAVTLDLSGFTQKIIVADCDITFTVKEDGIEALPLDLLDLAVDSVRWQGAPLNFDYDGLLLDVHLPNPVNVGDTVHVRVYYRGVPKISPGNFGGFNFEDNIGYNLGIGLGSNPYNFGRSWHPCFDNFVERATYDINIISPGGRKGYAIGEFLGETDLGNASFLRKYRMSQPLPTYLVGSATSNYAEVHQTHSGIYGDYPVLLVGKGPDTSGMKTAFTYLGNAVDVLEAWFGPYVWGQVGYVMTPRGAMEHASLIAFPRNSITSGPAKAMNRLMAHELAHHWWGNITTLDCPDNMWIKEGNAEYGAHLFTEYTFGKKAFIDEVKDNHLSMVLKKAHIEDGGNFLPLSGIPYEYTYGTHTYQKGASMMHNLRGYLGDTLFAKGMRSILTTYGFGAVDAELFRDQLTAETGVDMTSFFDDWIYSPGYASYELDSVNIESTPIPEEYKATVYIQQKLRAAPHFHTNVPLEVTFFDQNWNRHTASIMVSGEFSQATVTVPFQPVWQILNDNNKLNLARMQDRVVVKQTGNIPLFYCDFGSLPQAVAVPDSALFSFIHYWVAPDPVVPNPNQITMSTTHYWRYGGILPPGFKAKVLLEYRGSSVNDLDYALTNGNEDSLILVWRPNTKVPWGRYPYYAKLAVGGTTDGNGYIRIDTLLPGDYAFANGDLPVATAVKALSNDIAVSVYPNPAADAFTVEAALPGRSPVELTLFDAMGRVVRQEIAQVNGGRLWHQVSAGSLPTGMYWLRLTDREGSFMKMEKVVKK